MYDYLAKVILLGPSGSGKFVPLPTLAGAKLTKFSLRSCLLHRFVKNECTLTPVPAFPPTPQLR